MPVQKFRARMKTKYDYHPEDDPALVEEFAEYFTKAADEEEGESGEGSREERKGSVCTEETKRGRKEKIGVTWNL